MLETRIQRNVAGEIALALSDPSLKNAFLFPIAVSTLCHDGLFLPIAVLVLSCTTSRIGVRSLAAALCATRERQTLFAPIAGQLYQCFKFYIYRK